MTDRTIWRTVKVRAADLKVGDVTRDLYAKWATVTKVAVVSERYTRVIWDSQNEAIMRCVQLVDVQVPAKS